MTWGELIAEFNQQFGPSSKHPKVFQYKTIADQEVYAFLQSRLLTKEVLQKFDDMHFSVCLFIPKQDVELEVTMQESHPLWDMSLRYGSNRKTSTIMRFRKKRLSSGQWGCILEVDEDRNSEIDLAKTWCIQEMERCIVKDLNRVKVLDKVIKALDPEMFSSVKDAVLGLLGMSRGALDLHCWTPTQISGWGDYRNIMIPATRLRLLNKLSAYEGKPSDIPAPAPVDISLRDLIANAEVMESGRTCPPELVDVALDWILNGHNNLLERLDDIVHIAVYHAIAASEGNCPHCVSGECDLAIEDSGCKGTRAEQYECAYRQN